MDTKRIFYYFRIWWMMTNYTAKIALQSRFGIVAFLVGKLFRFGFFMFFLYLLLGKVKTLVGYSFWEVFLIFATLNFIDNITQLLFREVYRFRTYVLRGFFDYILTKPFSPLFRSLFGGSDVYDTPMLFLSFGLIVFAAIQAGITSAVLVMWYLLLLVNAFFIILSIHIFVLSIGVITTAVDNAIMVYRDTLQMGRVPVNIYSGPLRFVITFVIPIGVMVTFPVNALIGILSLQLLLVSFFIGVLFFALSLFVWQYALRQYSSASS